MSPKHNYKCFAIKDSTCTITTRKNCICCPFFKTKKQFEDDKKKSFKIAKERGYYENVR